MEVISVYRRQELIKEICHRLNYQGRYVWLVPTSRITVLASVFSGGSRLRFRMLDISTEPILKPKFVVQDGHKVKLDTDTVLTALPTLRSRRRDLLVFMHPVRFYSRYWSTNGIRPLSPEEKCALRQQEKFDPATMSVARAVCNYRRLADLRGRPTALGLQALQP